MRKIFDRVLDPSRLCLLVSQAGIGGGNQPFAGLAAAQGSLDLLRLCV
jgi:hypothetical protein